MSSPDLLLDRRDAELSALQQGHGLSAIPRRSWSLSPR
jgi:hypothetical protein